MLIKGFKLEADSVSVIVYGGSSYPIATADNLQIEADTITLKQYTHPQETERIDSNSEGAAKKCGQVYG